MKKRSICCSGWSGMETWWLKICIECTYELASTFAEGLLILSANDVDLLSPSTLPALCVRGPRTSKSIFLITPSVLRASKSIFHCTVSAPYKQIHLSHCTISAPIHTQGRKRQEGLVEKLLRNHLDQRELDKLEVSAGCGEMLAVHAGILLVSMEVQEALGFAREFHSGMPASDAPGVSAASNRFLAKATSTIAEPCPESTCKGVQENKVLARTTRKKLSTLCPQPCCIQNKQNPRCAAAAHLIESQYECPSTSWCRIMRTH
eukprot:1159532-Pelagomonas_calceolata.AAC.1